MSARGGNVDPIIRGSVSSDRRSPKSVILGFQAQQTPGVGRSARQAVVLGSFSQVSSVGGIAIGSGLSNVAAPEVTANGGIAIGASDHFLINGAVASGLQSIAIGSGDATTAGASATGTYSLSIGLGSSASSTRSIAIGTVTLASSSDCIAIGAYAVAGALGNAIAIGPGVNATSAPAASNIATIAIGANNDSGVAGAKASANGAIAIGSGVIGFPGAAASATDSIAIGKTATAAHANAIALGASVSTTATSQLNIGTARAFNGAPTTAPADADLINNQYSIWNNNGAPTLKMKDNGGVVSSTRLGVPGNLWLSGASGWPSTTSGATANAKVELATNKENIYVIDFVDASTTYAEWLLAMPSDYDGGTITAKFYWTNSNSNTQVVMWGIAATAWSDNENLDGTAFSANTTVTDANTASATPKLLISAATGAVTIANSPAGSDLVDFRVARVGADASDTLTSNARLLGVMITYTRA